MASSSPKATATDDDEVVAVVVAAASTDNHDNEVSVISEPVKKRARTSNIGSKVTELPPVLANLSAKETKPLLVIETREVKCDHKDENFPMGSLHPMVIGVRIPGTGTEGDEEVFDLFQLKSEISRKFGQKMGIRNASKMKGEKIYFLMAARINSDDLAFESTTPIKEPSHAETHRRHNTVLRLINALFSPEFLPQFLVWKDVVVQRRGRHKEEAMANMSSRAKNLFRNIAKVLFADIENPSSDGFGLFDTFDNQEGANLEIAYEWKAICKLGESPFVELEAKQLEDVATRLVKSRLVVLDTIKERASSPSTKSDPWLYVYEALKATCSVRNVGKFPLYYFCLKAAGVTQFDSHLHSIGFKTSRVSLPDSASKKSSGNSRRLNLSSLANAAAGDAGFSDNEDDLSAGEVPGDVDEKMVGALISVASSLKAWSQSSARVNEEQRKLHQANWQLQQIEIRRKQGAEIDELYARLNKVQSDEHLSDEVKERMAQRLTAQLEQKINILYPNAVHSL